MMFARSARLVRPSGHRLYSKREEEQLIKDVEAAAAQLKSSMPRGVSVEEQVRLHQANAKADYAALHKNLSGLSSEVEEIDGGVYDLSAAQQKAVSAWKAAYDAEMKPLVEKYGSDLDRGLARVNNLMNELNAPMAAPVRVAITGAAGNIGYSALFRLASGGVFGPNVPVILQLLELPQAMNALEGVVMELNDCAFPTLRGIVTTNDAETAFANADYVLMVGAQPRTKGMERGDLLTKNAEIFSTQGKALRKAKGKGTRVIVVGNPANTNALIASANSSSVPRENFVAMTRLDHNRGLAQIAAKVNVEVDDIDRFVIWGNHSATQFPDVTHALINKGGQWQEATSLLDSNWLTSTFIPTVQKRGAEIIAARGASSAASAGSSALDQLRDWHFGTHSKWTSAAVSSKGEYGVQEGLFYSYPVVFNADKEWDIVRNLPITPASAQLMEATNKELIAERDAISHLLPK